ncbi:MAG: cytochrome c oxidase subunit II [Thermoanaerobaculia bacterium]
MLPNSPVFPPVSSTLASKVDMLFFFTLGVSVLFSVLIVATIVAFLVKYRRRHAAETGQEITGNTLILELTWSVIPLGLVMVSFFWGAAVFFESARPPADAWSFHVYGKQWMWKVEHPEGKREINEFHVPVNQAVKLTMTSEDVIHNFSVPAFRLKMDVLPGRYTTAWFKATKTGTYHIFCDQYCGVDHSKMVGKIHVMEPQDYQKWLAGGASAGGTVASGEELFVAKACNTCHRPDSSARAPVLDGVFGRQVALVDGRAVLVDESYVRESILSPAAKVVQGYQPIMPTFKDQVSEEEIVQLIRYIKELEPAGAAAGPAAAAPAAGGKS